MRTDTDIQKDVMDEILWEPFLRINEIGVTVRNGVVTLTGSIDAYSKKMSALKAAQRVKGVKAVAEELEIKLPTSDIRDDSDIAEAVVNALKWNNMIDEDKIMITVEDGWVTLDGEVEWDYQRNAASNAISDLTGVSGVTNNIKLKPSSMAEDVKKKISSAFQRNASLDANKISVTTNGSKVILKGIVRSFAEYEDAELAAWQAPGIEEVENWIEIEDEILA